MLYALGILCILVYGVYLVILNKDLEDQLRETAKDGSIPKKNYYLTMYPGDVLGRMQWASSRLESKRKRFRMLFAYTVNKIY